MVTILETMADYAGRVKEMEQMGELVRASVSRTITRQFSSDEGALTCVTLDPTVEHAIQEAVQHTAGGVTAALDPALSKSLVASVKAQLDTASGQGHQPVLLCGSQSRLPLRKLLERNAVFVPVLAYNEVAASANVEFVGQVTFNIDQGQSLVA